VALAQVGMVGGGRARLIAQRGELTTIPGGNPASPPPGAFRTRSPGRPDPIGLHPAQIPAVEGLRILVSELEAPGRGLGVRGGGVLVSLT
jgi:hypothetical protein